MRNILATLFIIAILSQNSFAQTTTTTNNIRPKALGVSFILNDYATAQRIKNGSFEQVIREKSFSKIGQMSPGLALTYFKGLQKHIDFAGTLAASFVNYPVSGRTSNSSDGFLLEADASVNLKMFSENYVFTPYIIAGVGASKYKNYYGAFMPLGGGVKFNLFNEAAIFITAQYRLGITPETTANHFMFSFGIAGLIGGNN